MKKNYSENISQPQNLKKYQETKQLRFGLEFSSGD